MTQNFSLICQIRDFGSGQILQSRQLYLSPGLAKIAPWWLARRDKSCLKYRDSYRRTAPPTFTPSTAGPLCATLSLLTVYIKTMKFLPIIFIVFIIGCSGQHNPQKKKLRADSMTFQTENLLNSVNNRNQKNIDSIIYYECNYKELSYTFDYKVKVKKMLNTIDYYDSSIVKIYIIDKNTNNFVDSVSFTSLFLTYNSFQDCNNVRSYISGKNETQIISDNNYGQLVIVDLNFDSKEDIAIIHDSGEVQDPTIVTSFRIKKILFTLTNS